VSSLTAPATHGGFGCTTRRSGEVPRVRYVTSVSGAARPERARPLGSLTQLLGAARRSCGAAPVSCHDVVFDGIGGRCFSNRGRVDARQRGVKANKLFLPGLEVIDDAL
jgi:hypothetical protein